MVTDSTSTNGQVGGEEQQDAFHGDVLLGCLKAVIAGSMAAGFYPM